MKTRDSREWFKIGVKAMMFVYIDFILQYPIACIEADAGVDESIPSFMPNADEPVFKLIARAQGGTKEFIIDPHAEFETNQIIHEAMDWCEDNSIPPIARLNRWSFTLRCLMFWKYDYIKREGRIIGLKLKGEPYDIDKVFKKE